MPGQWTTQAISHLIEAIAEVGGLTTGTTSNPLGRVKQWNAVEDKMKNDHQYTFTKNAMQSQWSREACGKLSRTWRANADIIPSKPEDVTASRTLRLVAKLAGDNDDTPTQANAIVAPITDLGSYKEQLRRMSKLERRQALGDISAQLSALVDVMEENGDGDEDAENEGENEEADGDVMDTGLNA